MREGNVSVEPKATHEVRVIRANGEEEVVAQRSVSPAEARLILEAMRREAPEMVDEAEANAKANALAQKEATKNG